MIIIILTISFLLASFILFKKNADYSNGWDEAGLFLTCCSGLLFVLAVILLPLFRIGSRDLVRRYHSVELTIKTQRKGAESIERAALINKMLEINADLADAQYYAQNNWTNWYYDTSTGLLDLTPLQ